MRLHGRGLPSKRMDDEITLDRQVAAMFSRPALLSVVIAVSACTPAATPAPDGGAATARIMRFEVSNPQGPGDYLITWQIEGSSSVMIEAVTDPHAPPGSGLLVLGEAPREGDMTWQSPDATRRYYFLARLEDGDTEIAAARVLPLEGGRNFRDLGGYDTADGHTVRWGKIYRSGVMDSLTPADYAYLDSLGIKVVCDLRTAQERASEPTNWQASPVRSLQFPDPASADPGVLAALFSDPGVTAESVRAAVIEFYDDILVEQAPAYTAMFDELATGGAPLAFHCSAGKDRTGIGAALILAALGVPEETIIADYALSEQLVDFRTEFGLDSEAPADADDGYAFLRKLPPELVAPLLRSDPAYIESVLAKAKAEHGSLIGYIKAELDVTEAELAAMRTDLLVRKD